MGTSVITKQPRQRTGRNEATGLRESTSLDLEDLLWEYIEEHGFTTNAKRYFEAQYPIAT